MENPDIIGISVTDRKRKKIFLAKLRLPGHNIWSKDELHKKEGITFYTRKHKNVISIDVKKKKEKEKTLPCF